MSRRPLAPLVREPSAQFRPADIKASQSGRHALGDITNRTVSGPVSIPREILPPIEHMHLPPDPPKYKGYEFVPSDEPWFDSEIQLEPVSPLAPIQWL